MITITNPNNYTTVRNELIIFDIITDNYIVIPKQSAVIQLNRPNPLVVGQKLTYLLSDTSAISFTVAVNPDNSGTQFKAGADIFDNAKTLQNNYYINQLYTVVAYAPNNIILTSKDSVTIFDNQFYNEDTGSFTSVIVHQNTDASYQKYFKFIPKIFVSKDFTTSEEILINTYLYPNEEQKAQFNISKLLIDYFGELLPPSYSLLQPQKFTGVLLEYFIKVCETYTTESNLVFSSYTQTDKQYCFNGISNFNEYPSKNIFAEIQNSKRWLNTQPLKHFTVRDCPQYLFYMAITNNYSYHLNISVYYTNGKSINYNLFDFYADKNEIYCIPVDTNTLGIYEKNTQQTPYKYAVKLVNDEQIVASQTVEYTIIDTPYNCNVYMFLNTETGVYETMICSGDCSLEQSAKYNNVQRNISLNYEPLLGTEINNLSEKTYTYKQYTGYYQQSVISFYRQLIETPNNLYVLKNNRWTKCILKDFSSEIFNQQENLFSFNFTYELTSYEV